MFLNNVNISRQLFALLRVLVFAGLLVPVWQKCLVAEEDSLKQDAANGFALIVSGNELSETALRNVRRVRLLGLDPLSNGKQSVAKDIDLEQLERAANLQSILISASGVTEKGLAHLSQLKHLQVVEYAQMRSADRQLKVLSEFPSLEKLVIPRSDLTEEGIRHISTMKKLKYLDIREAKVDTNCFEKHALPKSITHLVLNGTNVDSRIVKFLPKSITHLSMHGTKVDESIIPELIQLNNLQALEISASLTQHQMKKIREGLPNTTINVATFSTF